MIDIILKRTELKVEAEGLDPINNKEEFAEARHSGIGASDSRLLLDVPNLFASFFEEKSQAHLIQQKGHKITNDELSNKPVVRKGSELEDFIMNKAEQLMKDRNIIDSGTIISKPEDMYRYKDTPLLINFDGVTVIDDQLIPVEIKLCNSPWSHKGWDFNKAIASDLNPDQNYDAGIPTVSGKRIKPSLEQHLKVVAEHYGFKTNKNKDGEFINHIGYYTQLQQQMLGLNAPYGYLAVLDDKEWELHIFKIYRDDRVIDTLLDQAPLVWAKVKVIRGRK